ncbi:MAG: hypothetical protein MUD01_09505 [Chloroflexaceae bacterium]|nr:hypothetical protein [Chloroflexaceae bacterium]
MNQRRIMVVAVSIGLVLIALAMGAVAVIASGGPLPVRSIGPYAIVPEKAAADMLNNRGTISNFQVVQRQRWPGGQLVVYNYTVQPPGQPLRREFGFALVEMRAGWSVFDAQLFRQASPPATISYAVIERNGQTIIYGAVANPDMVSVLIRTHQGTQQQVSVANNGFALVVPGSQSVQEIQGLQRNGQSLEQHTTP